MYEVIAQAQVSRDGVQGSISGSLETIQKGTNGLIRLNAYGIAPFFDIAGAEWVAQQVFDFKGVDITVVDVYGEGLNNAYILFRGSPAFPVAILAAIPGILIGLSILIGVVTVSILIWKAVALFPTNPGASIGIIIGVGAAILGGIALYGWSKGRH